MAGHQVSIVSASVVNSGISRVGAPPVERVESVADHATVPATGGGGAQCAQFLLRDPRREDLPGRIVIDAAIPHPRQRGLREPLPPAQQQPPVRPRRIGPAATATEQIPGDTLAHRGHRRVGEHDQMEVIDRDPRVRERGTHSGGVAGVWIDHHHFDGVAERRATCPKPCLHRGAGPAVDLPQHRLITGDVDEPGLPRIRALPADPAASWCPSGNQRGRPNRVSSTPSTVVGSGSTSSTAPRATTARCTVGHDTPCAAATSD